MRWILSYLSFEWGRIDEGTWICLLGFETVVEDYRTNHRLKRHYGDFWL